MNCVNLWDDDDYESGRERIDSADDDVDEWKMLRMTWIWLTMSCDEIKRRFDDCQRDPFLILCVSVWGVSGGACGCTYYAGDRDGQSTCAGGDKLIDLWSCTCEEGSSRMLTFNYFFTLKWIYLRPKIQGGYIWDRLWEWTPLYTGNRQKLAFNKADFLIRVFTVLFILNPTLKGPPRIRWRMSGPRTVGVFRVMHVTQLNRC